MASLLPPPWVTHGAHPGNQKNSGALPIPRRKNYIAASNLETEKEVGSSGQAEDTRKRAAFARFPYTHPLTGSLHWSACPSHANALPFRAHLQLSLFLMVYSSDKVGIKSEA